MRSYQEWLHASIDPGLPVHHPAAFGRFDGTRLARPFGAGGSVAEVSDLDELRSIEELTSHQKDVQARIGVLNQDAAGVPFDDDQRAEFKALTEVNDEIGRRIKELEAREAYIAGMASQPRSRVRVDDDLPGPKPSLKERDIFDLSTVRVSLNDPSVARMELRDRAMRAVEIGHFEHFRGQISQEQAQSHLAYLLDEKDTEDGQLARHILTTGSPVYRRAFAKMIAGVALSQEEQRAFSLGTTGIPIPYVLDPTVIPVSNSVVNPLRAISDVEQIVGANEWRGTTAAAITAARATEGTEASDNTPTLAQPTIVASRVQAFVPFSIEAGADWTGLEANMARLFADAKDDEEATAFTTGNGTPPNPFGLLTGVTNTVAASTGLTVTAANLYSLEGALPPRFRPLAQFVANRAIYNIIRALDTAGGAQLWLRIGELMGNAPASSGGNGNTGLRLLGYAVNELSTMSATVVNGTKIMVLGDFRYFKIIDRVGMTVDLIPHLMGASGRPTGQRGLYAYWRNGSKVLDAAAFRALTGTT